VTVYVLGSKLAGVCMTGLIAVGPHTYIAAHRTQVSSQHTQPYCATFGRDPPEAPSQNQQTSAEAAVKLEA
jgi:hypothetical protein